MKSKIDMFLLGRTVRAAYDEPSFAAYRNAGRLVVDGLFRGNVKLIDWKVVKEFSRVAEIPPNRLKISIRLHIACLSEPKIAKIKRVSQKHFKIVMSREPAEILRILTEASEAGQSARDLMYSLEPRPNVAGKMRLPDGVKTLRAAARLADKIAAVDPADLDEEQRADALDSIMKLDLALGAARAAFGIYDEDDE